MAVDGSSLSPQAEKAKAVANQAFKEHRYNEAVAGYTEAIEHDPTNPIYYSNRAVSNIRLEAFGSAIQDATKAIDLDSDYPKAYYHRGSAAFALSHFKDAVTDFRAAARLAPRDPDVRKKLAEAVKEFKRTQFEAALALPEDTTSALDSVHLEDIDVEASYIGPRMEEQKQDDGTAGYQLTLDFVKAMMEEFKEQRMVHRRFILQILLTAHRTLSALPSLVDLDIPPSTHITVCGDTHGQFYDLMRIFELNGLPSADNPYVFNGDFVDRGSFSVEVILTLLAFKALDPRCMHLTRGNHESKSMNVIYGFYGEVKAKLGPSAVEQFRELFCALPLAYVLGGKVMVVHGGIPTCPGGDLASLRKIDRTREPPDEGPMCECLWNDPQEELGTTPNKRGVGVAWGPDRTQKYLTENGLSLVVRSHEVKEEGYELTHDGYCCTIFSAPNYCDQMGNKGAFIKFNGDDMVPHFTQFNAAPHPNVRPMQYAAGMMNGMFGM
jgi:serine/threonine-protein phosphatase 5